MSCIRKFIAPNGVLVPCGQCLPCKQRRASNWSIRLQEEARHKESCYFLSLTYDDWNIPYTESGYQTLFWEDLNNFTKSLRERTKRFNKKFGTNHKFAYYAVGEYGGETHRPHYHIISIDCPLQIILGYSSIAEMALNSPSKYLNGKHHFHPMNNSTWNKGVITIGNCEPASIGYCLEYITKPSIIPAFDGDDREKEKACMSRNIGISYIKRNKKYHMGKDYKDKLYTLTLEGQIVSMPRLFKNKIYSKTRLKMINAYLADKINTKDQIKRSLMTNEQLIKHIDQEFRIDEELECKLTRKTKKYIL